MSEVSAIVNDNGSVVINATQDNGDSCEIQIWPDDVNVEIRSIRNACVPRVALQELIDQLTIIANQ